MEPMEQDAARLLAPLRDLEPTSPSTVNVHRAVHAGMRRKRTRAIGAVVVAAAAVLAAILVPTLVSHRTSLPPAGPGFDVLKRNFSVGSAGGYTPVSYETGRDRQRIRLGPAHEFGQPDRSGLVTMYAPGRGPEPAGEPAPEVNGRRALWLPAPVEGGPGTEVAWEWSAGAWGFALVDGVGDEGRANAHRVAESVAAGGAPVSVPFTIPSPGGELELAGVITPFGTSSDPTAGALLVLNRHNGADSDRVLVGVVRQPAWDLVTGKARTAPPAAIPLRDGYFAIADGPLEHPEQLAGSVRLSAGPTSNPLR